MSNEKKCVPVTEAEKNAQIAREARATMALFFLCFLWHVGFGYGLSGTGIYVLGLPLWWLVSVPGLFVVAVIGVAYLLKKVFVNFELGEEVEEHE